MPWIHFHTGDDGIAKACCVANIPYGNINTDDFDSIWKGDSIAQIREKFAKGERDNRCASCFKLEEAGGTSIRQETFEKYPDVDISNITPPIYFDIRFSNVCNFKCRTCWHGASSAWYEDAKKLGTNKGSKAVIKNIENYADFIQKVGPSLLGAKEIYLAGGEPLVTEEHYQLLNWLIEKGASQMKLRYNTNFSVLTFKGQNVLDLWTHFKEVEILASIDAVESLGEYIRSGTNWDRIISNYAKIHKLSNISFKISPTVSLLNVAYLPELIRYFVDRNMVSWDDFYINILERPYHYNIQTFPGKQKTKVTQVLQDFKLEINPKDVKLAKQIDEIINYMNALDRSKLWSKFEQETKKLDELRKD